MNSAAERILHCLEFEGADGEFLLTQSRKAWACELGLTHEALYRALKSLRSKGVIDVVERGENLVLRVK